MTRVSSEARDAPSTASSPDGGAGPFWLDASARSIRAIGSGGPGFALELERAQLLGPCEEAHQQPLRLLGLLHLRGMAARVDRDLLRCGQPLPHVAAEPAGHDAVVPTPHEQSGGLELREPG